MTAIPVYPAALTNEQIMELLRMLAAQRQQASALAASPPIYQWNSLESALLNELIDRLQPPTK